jgi:hypothetical protein
MFLLGVALMAAGAITIDELRIRRDEKAMDKLYTGLTRIENLDKYIKEAAIKNMPLSWQGLAEWINEQEGNSNG